MFIYIYVHSTSIKVIYFVIKTFPRRKCPGLDSFTGEFYQTLEEEITPILFKYIKIERGRGITAQLFSKASMYGQLVFGKVVNAI